MRGEIRGADSREVGQGDHDGRAARIVVVGRSFPTDPDDLWDALTNPERIPLWFTPITGDLDLGGRYQLEGNAGGEITQCVAPWAFAVTWEFGGVTSHVSVGLSGRADGTRLTLEHILPIEADDSHWAQFGPGAVGVGWDLSLMGLGLHLQPQPVDRAEILAWMTSDEARAFLRESAAAWGETHIACGEPPEIARAMAVRTAEAYAGAG